MAGTGQGSQGAAVPHAGAGQVPTNTAKLQRIYTPSLSEMRQREPLSMRFTGKVASLAN